MKMIELLIPSNYLSLGVRVGALLFVFFIWLLVLYVKYFVCFVDGWIHLGGVYFIWGFGSFLLDRSIPTAPVSMHFERGSFPIVIMRAIAGGASLLMVFVIMIFADWK